MIFEIDKKQVFASTAGKEFDPTKKTVFLLHGSGLSHIVWSLAEQFLSNKDLNILSLDLPGHGNSDGPCIDSIEKIADWIESVRLFLKTEQVLPSLYLKFQLVFLLQHPKLEQISLNVRNLPPQI